MLIFSAGTTSKLAWLHDYTCRIENSAVMDLISPLTKLVLCFLVALGFIFTRTCTQTHMHAHTRAHTHTHTHTHTQSHIMGKRLTLTLRHWPWQWRRAHFSTFFSWSPPHLCSLSLPPHLSVVFLILLKLCCAGCIYSLHCILHRCVNMWCVFTPLHYETTCLACFHEHQKM